MTEKNELRPTFNFNKSAIFTNILVAIITAISVLGGHYILSKSNETVGEYQTDNQTVVALIEKVNELQIQVQSLQKDYAALSNENLALKAEINKLRSMKEYGDLSVSAFFKFMPLPAWIKVYDDDMGLFIMRKINRAYEDQWDISNIRYAGRSDKLIWDEVTSKMFEIHDNAVRDELSPIITIEEIPNNIDDPSKGKTEWIVAKFPVSLNGINYNAVGGIAIPEEIRDYVNFPKYLQQKD